jgi:hypothetical protein
MFGSLAQAVVAVPGREAHPVLPWQVVVVVVLAVCPK